MKKSDELEELDLEFWFERESRPFKLSRGSSGMQINAQECPACGDRRYRTYLNAETGVGNCFVCNERFNKGTFIVRSLGLDPDNRLDWGAAFKHIREVLVDQGWRPKRMSAVAVEHGEVKLPRSFPLPTPEGHNLQYLEDRGVTADYAKYFGLRVSTIGQWRFKNDDGTDGSQNFSNRLIIPVYDLDGTLKTFQGRDLTGESDRKYLFPKGLPGTGRYLLNGQNAHHAKRICVGEGFFDVAAIKIAMDQDVSLRDVVAVGSFGKHLSFGQKDGDDQLSRLIALKREGLEEVTMMWDGEWKALIAALDAAEQIARVGLRARIATLPADRDPNEVTGDVVRAAFLGARPFSKLLAVEWRLRNPLVA